MHNEIMFSGLGRAVEKIIKEFIPEDEEEKGREIPLAEIKLTTDKLPRSITLMYKNHSVSLDFSDVKAEKSFKFTRSLLSSIRFRELSLKEVWQMHDEAYGEERSRSQIIALVSNLNRKLTDAQKAQKTCFTLRFVPLPEDKLKVEAYKLIAYITNDKDTEAV